MFKNLANLALAAALVIMPLGIIACQPPSGSVACTITSASQLSCTYSGITVAVPIPADIALVLGLLTPSGLDATKDKAAAIPVVCKLDTKHEIVNCTNNATQKSASYHPAPDQVKLQ